MQLRLRVYIIKIITCKCDLTCANVRSFTSISSRTDFGVAPIIKHHRKQKKELVEKYQI